MSIPRVVSGALALLVLSGCVRVRASFPGEDPEQVWTALVAVAETPTYYERGDAEERWFVKENAVWVDEANARIEIYRELDRVLHRERTRPVRQHRTWRFQILYDPVEPPAAVFVSRGFAVPTKAMREGERYFADVRDVLAYGAAPAPAAPPAPPPEAPAPPPEPPIDVESLEPQAP